jgi:hypothetical protein
MEAGSLRAIRRARAEGNGMSWWSAGDDEFAVGIAVIELAVGE